MKSHFIITCLVIVSLPFWVSSCNQELPKINFGTDICMFCKMTVIDQKFGGLLINNKGKKIGFDSEECLINYMKTDNQFEADKILVIDYSNPTILIEAKNAFYIHGSEVRSPMGGNVAAFKTKKSAEQFQRKLHADLLLWDEVMSLNF